MSTVPQSMIDNWPGIEPAPRKRVVALVVIGRLRFELSVTTRKGATK